MAYNSISIKPYIKSHLELQREITLIELAPSPYFLAKYQIVPSKAVVGVDWSMKAPSMHIEKPYYRNV